MPGGAPQVLGGPVWWLLVAVYVLTAVLGLFVLVDSARPGGRARFAVLREPWWLYVAAETVYLCLLFGVWAPNVPRVLSAIPVLLTPFALALGVAYLLRVVYPKPAVADDAPASDEEEDDAQPTQTAQADEDSASSA